MDHSWRPHPIQGNNNNNNICPTCSISHFPFCPPHPHPSRFPGPNFEPIRSPINMGRPVYHNPPDPYHDSGHWNRNPNFPPQVGEFGTVNCNDSISSSSSRDFYSMQNHGYVGSDYDRSYGNCVNDDSKRLRVDGVNSRSSRREFAGNMAKPLMESGPQLGFGFNGGVRGYAQDRAGFDRSFENQEYGYSNNGGMRGPSSVEMGNGSVGRGVDYRREELDYRSGYESGHLMKRSVSDPGHGRVGNEIQGHNHQVGQYGQVAKPPDLGSFHHGGTGHGGDWQSYGFDHPNYGNNFAPLRSNNAAMQYENRNSMATAKQYSDSHVPLHTSMAQVGQMDYGPGSFGGSRQPLETMPPPVEGYQGPISNQRAPVHPLSGSPMDKHSRFGYSVSEPMGHQRAPQGFDFRPPLPSSPPPPLPREPPPVHWSAEHRPSCSPPRASSSLTPVPGSQSMLTTFGQYSGRSQHLPPKNNLHDKPKTVDAAHLFKPPHRTSRPDHFVIILRGLPGSGKSYIAKMLRDLEMEHGGSAPRIHSMDDYFMTEVEKADENSASKSSARGKKPKGKVVLEYCYEPEMEEAYRSSLLKAFRKTVEEGVFTFVIVDDRNLRVADFAQFWATAKRSGYEAYVLEAPYKDPAGCTARNVHGFSHDDVEKMAAQWEEAPSLYLQLDVKSLFHGDALTESSIQEVDMDTEDGDCDGSLSNVDERKTEKNSAAGKFEHDVSPEEEKDTDEIINRTEVKELGRSKWSDDLDDDDRVGIEVLKGKANSLSTLLGTYGKEGKSVHWGDQGGSSGFSIGAVKKARMTSLVIGPGSGYNMKSNPLVEDDAVTAQSSEKQKHNVFQERLRAERESFKAVFDKRRHRIGGLLEDE